MIGKFHFALLLSAVFICPLEKPLRGQGATERVVNVAQSALTSRFDPSGDYHVADRNLAASIGHAYFDLDVQSRRGKLIAWGHVYARITFFPIRRISVTRNRLAFTTRSVEGVFYRFDGRFTRTGVFADQFISSGTIAAQGTLTRVVNGRVEISVNSQFLYYPGC